MTSPHYPSLLQVNTRVWLTELARGLGRQATLDDIPEGELERIAGQGFDWIWFLSVWQIGEAGRNVSRNNAEWRREFQDTLPDLCDDDIPGSGFAITDYRVSKLIGGDDALARLRERLRKYSLRLMLDFVPNHTGLDHPWVVDHPEFYIKGTGDDIARVPQNYVKVKGRGGDLILAHGRDPYFSGWPDTLQLNYGNPATQAAMMTELARIASQCDGVRCDMAMLVLPEVFERTWGIKSQPFWPEATRKARSVSSTFRFMAEVYWDLEWQLQNQGFDYAYDKRLYDRLRECNPRPIREHFLAGLEYQNKLARFLENHDEPRAAATFPSGTCEAAAVITFLAPGLRFFHQGQFEGRLKRISPHLCRAPDEKVNGTLQLFYDRLLRILRLPVVRLGNWQLLECAPAWAGNGSNDSFIAFAWQLENPERLIVVVNYSDHYSQCYLRLPFSDLEGRRWHLCDLLGDAAYEREGGELSARGLYLDVPPWRCHIFEMKPE
jgi:hypothetical protein